MVQNNYIHNKKPVSFTVQENSNITNGGPCFYNQPLGENFSEGNAGKSSQNQYKRCICTISIVTHRYLAHMYQM